MSSYYPSFNLMGFNSLKDKHLMVVHFESGDSGEMDTFLGMDQIYTENPYGTKRLTYGAKYNNVAVIRISVMKTSGNDFSVAETREFLKWTTGSRQNSYLDLVDGDRVVVSFLGHVTAVYQQKVDARTVGFIIEHTSVSPWAYSSIQSIVLACGQTISVDSNGVLDVNTSSQEELPFNDDGTLGSVSNAVFRLDNSGVLYIEDNSININIDNPSDDLYSCVYMDTEFKNINGTYVNIENKTLQEITTIENLAANEVIKLNSNQFIVSNNETKTFGYDFNFIWPKLGPGDNNILVRGDGECTVSFSYRYPIKIGDCAMDIVVNGGGVCGGCEDVISHVDPIFWSEILEIPTTIGGYGITDAYTSAEVDRKIASVNVTIDEAQLNEMLDDTLT